MATQVHSAQLLSCCYGQRRRRLGAWACPPSHAGADERHEGAEQGRGGCPLQCRKVAVYCFKGKLQCIDSGPLLAPPPPRIPDPQTCCCEGVAGARVQYGQYGQPEHTCCCAGSRVLLLLPHLSPLSPSICGRFTPAWHSGGMTVLRPDPDEAAARLLQQPKQPATYPVATGCNNRPLHTLKPQLGS